MPLLLSILRNMLARQGVTGEHGTSAQAQAQSSESLSLLPFATLITMLRLAGCRGSHARSHRPPWPQAVTSARLLTAWTPSSVRPSLQQGLEHTKARQIWAQNQATGFRRQAKFQVQDRE